MINFPTLSVKDMEIFEGKKVFVYSYDRPVDSIYFVFKYFNIEVIGYCIESSLFQPSLQARLKNKLRGISYIKPQNLERFFNENPFVMVQTASDHKKHGEELNKKLMALNYEGTNLSSGEILNSFSHLVVLDRLKKPLRYYGQKAEECYHKLKKNPLFSHKYNGLPKNNFTLQWMDFQSEHGENTVVICSPTKTGDFTLMNTFDKLNKCIKPIEKSTLAIDYINLWHSPHRINRTFAEEHFHPFKIIVGIREPIAQNLSDLFQQLSTSVSLMSYFQQDLLKKNSTTNKKQLVKKYEELFKDGMDVQALWDIYTSLYVNQSLVKKEGAATVGKIQDFIEEFSCNVINITDYPFDKERGYSIIRDTNTEIFIYQIEKLNSLAPILSKWIGVSFDEFENGNQASDKWIAESYEQAQKEIEITQEYFNKCFNEAYVKHCYSEADIEKFKAHWRPHIKKTIL